MQRTVRSVLARANLDAERILAESQELVLFGSRAAGVETPRSDWDILVVGGGEPRSLQDLDLLVLPPSKVATSDWLGSEPGQHVARYGVWVRCDGLWRHETHPSQRAILATARFIEARAGAVAKGWSRLGPPQRQKYALLLRRDFQRLALLRSGLTVPPTPMLDASWTSAPLARLGAGDPRLQELLSRETRELASSIAAQLGAPSTAP